MPAPNLNKWLNLPRWTAQAAAALNEAPTKIFKALPLNNETLLVTRIIITSEYPYNATINIKFHSTSHCTYRTYQRCLERRKRDFFYTGPRFLRSGSWSNIVMLVTGFRNPVSIRRSELSQQIFVIIHSFNLRIKRQSWEFWCITNQEFSFSNVISLKNALRKMYSIHFLHQIYQWWKYSYTQA